MEALFERHKNREPGSQSWWKEESEGCSMTARIEPIRVKIRWHNQQMKDLLEKIGNSRGETQLGSYSDLRAERMGRKLVLALDYGTCNTGVAYHKVRATRASLGSLGRPGWTSVSLQKLCAVVLKESEDPYLESYLGLLPDFTSTVESPQRVSLDQKK